MKEKALSQENQIYSKDGLISTKVVDFRQQFLENKSSKISDDLGLKECRQLVYLIWDLTECKWKHSAHRALWILHTQGKEALRKHREFEHIDLGL